MTEAGLQLKNFVLAAFLAAALTAPPASAQLMLPGALQAAPPEGSGKPASHAAGPDHASAGQAKPKPVGLKPPGEETIIGRDLARDGAEGLIAFRRATGNGLEITTLSISGEAISTPGEPCRIDVVAGAPIATRLAGKPNGLLRYDVDIQACPFSLEVLDGAVLVTLPAHACDFTAADCRVDPTGLWGPPGTAIEDGEVKKLERARGHAESDMRANFHALLSSAGKDKAAIKKTAAEQAGFSSEREVTCRNYAREEVHGFCALRLTQARAFALQAEFDARPKEQDGKKPSRPR